jgi:hypothetical protein
VERLTQRPRSTADAIEANVDSVVDHGLVSGLADELTGVVRR